MTLHGAKGLEFDAVFLPGWEDGLFPSQKTMDEHGIKGLEEERRLAYVGITRARKKVFISFASNRRMYGNWINSMPSRFVDELPPAHVKVTSETGIRAGRSSHCAEGRKVVSEQGVVFSRGDRVFHEKFGSGKIINIDGHKLDIAFEKSGTKRVMDSFIQKAE